MADWLWIPPARTVFKLSKMDRRDELHRAARAGSTVAMLDRILRYSTSSASMAKASDSKINARQACSPRR
jgi:hypothetical protein